MKQIYRMSFEKVITKLDDENIKKMTAPILLYRQLRLSDFGEPY